MADNEVFENLYFETDSEASKDECIESPLPIALVIITNREAF
jgi:hypothetical protein